MKLSQLRAALPEAHLLPPGSGPEDPEITGLSYDSRQVKPGDLFFCIRGLKSDGIRFLPDAAARGARAAVVEADELPVPLPALRVPNVRAAMPGLAAAFHRHPSRSLCLVGVTGTNGKTTTTYLVETLARAAGRATGVIGTINIRIDDQVSPNERTTPEAPDLQALMAQMTDTGGRGPRVVAMEASSHALVQDRTAGCEFDVGVFTNLTQDHLDYHADMEEYFQAKALLFTRYPGETEKPFTGVINADDPYGRRLIEMCPSRVVRYGIEADADLRARNVRASATGLEFEIAAPEGVFPVRIRLGGLFNVYNTLAAVGAARAAGISWDVIPGALADADVVPGRFEGVVAGQDFSVIVDYAHTPDGLENVLRAARALSPNRLIAVFGCGGDRDRKKRPIMGGLAAEWADLAIVTSDNPRTEDPDAIIAEILTGIPSTARAEVVTVPDRREAIRRAIDGARTGDLVLIAGKGHENYQIFADRTVHFDDREEAREALNARLSA